MRRILVMMVVCCFAAISGQAQYVTVTDIQLDEAGQLGYKVLEHYNAFEEVQGLRIAGPINDEDWKTLKEMFNLEELYMDEAEFSEVPGEQFSYSSGGYSLRTVTLPYSCERIGYNAFGNCYLLNSISMPGVTHIENNAFQSCNNLQTVNCYNVSHIGSYTFAWCYSLQTIDLPNVTHIDYNAFNDCNSLQSINLPNVSYIGSQAFYNCNQLASVSLSDQLTELENECFKECRALTSLVLPASLTYIPDGVFDNCNNIKEIECNAPNPPGVGTFPFANEVIYTATLRVQGDYLSAYQWDNFWGRFSHWEESPTRITDLILNYNHFLGESTRLDKLHLTINPGYALTIEGNALQEFKSVTLKADDSGCGMFLSRSEGVMSDATKIVYAMRPHKWYYLTLPFNARIEAVETTNNALFALYDYDGETRAANGIGNSWRNLTDGMMQAGKGYIIQVNTDCQLAFHADYSALNDAFLPYAVSVPVSEWPSALGASESGWNLVGNPYPTFFDIHYLDFTAPITVWDGSTYTAYSVVDDEFALSPLQPFFVQCPVGTEHIVFNTAGRQLTADIDHADTYALHKAPAANRHLLNLVLGTESTEADRTRIVVNAAASDDYELSCDAAKMFGTDASVPQLWTMRNGTAYAINEGPQAEGSVNVAFYAPQAGTYTLTAQRADLSVTLCDQLTGARIRLNPGSSYTFTAESGRDTGRFLLLLDKDVTSINDVPEAETASQAARYYTLDGRQVGTSAEALSPGIYIKTQNGKSVKVVIR